MTESEYLALLDWTGRQVRGGKGAIPSDLGPILSRLSVQPEKWTELVSEFGTRFKRAAGTAASLARAAAAAGKAWFQGIAACRKMFL